MEHRVLSELMLAFAVGHESGAVSRKDPSFLYGALLKEYTAKLLGVKQPHSFLD